MLFRNDAPATSKNALTRLDSAIIASVLAMGTLNLLVMADQIGPSKAYAATPCHCGTAARIALA